MSNSETLALADSQLPVVKVHSTAVFSILHSYMRSGLETNVFGSLLGVVKEGSVEIFDAFQVPFFEKAEGEILTVVIDEEYQKKMYDFHRRINKRETIVGWFSTTSAARSNNADTSHLKNEYYSKICKRPIFLMVDTTLTNIDNFILRAFIDKKIGLENEDSNFADAFIELKVEMALTESETSLLYHMINFQGSEDASLIKWSNSEIISHIPSERKQVVSSLENLLTLIDSLSQYTDNVVQGSQEAFPDIGMAISDILGSLQTISPDEILSLYRDKVQDLLMVSYMSTLAKTQAQLAAKLNSIL